MDGYDKVAHYAVLIGIDAYPTAPLRSCVQDVEDFRSLLEHLPFYIDVWSLTAPVTPEKITNAPVNEKCRSQWPTYQNVMQAFREIMSSAKDGDSVYIHFSGHGTRMEASNEFSNSSAGDLALVLLEDPGSDEVRYLEGLTLAITLNAMVAKGLRVTLVLDCCFAGSVLRNDHVQVRCFPTSTAYMPKWEQIRLQAPKSHKVHRDASMLPNWLIDPDGYAILTACGPHEITAEVENLSGKRNGALTRCLLAVVGAVDTSRLRYKELYEYLCALFVEHCPRQTPMFYGNKYSGFFGSFRSDLIMPLIPVVRRADKTLVLQMGQAHGIADGDDFALSRMEVKEDVNGKKFGLTQGAINAKVLQADSFTSTLQILDPTIEDTTKRWTAQFLSQKQLRQRSVWIGSTVPDLAALQGALDTRSIGSQTAGHRAIERSTAHCLSVSMDITDSYVIENNDSQNPVSLPVMPAKETSTDAVTNILEHLARFELVKSITHCESTDQPTFSKYIKVHISDRSGHAFYPDTTTTINLKQNSETKFDLELFVTNKSNRPIYVFVYNLGPTWQIENILRGNHDICPPALPTQGFSGVWRKRLKMMIPTDMVGRGLRQCDDIVKVFLTSQYTSFNCLELPKLVETFEGKRRRKTLTNGTATDDGQGNTARGGDDEDIELGRKSQTDEILDWAAFNFHIRTSLD